MRVVLKRTRWSLQAPVVRKVDNVIHRINHWIAWLVLLTLTYWIAIYPMDSVIQPINNPYADYHTVGTLIFAS